jgi:uncharacterized protein
MGWPCLKQHPDGVILRIRATPNAVHSRAEGLRADRLAVRLKAPPVEGKANREATRWAAKAFGLRASAIVLIRGERAREKDLLLTGLSSEQAGKILAELIGTSD